MKNLHKILILDFGSQFTQLIGRKIRENGVYCEIKPFHISLNEIKEFSPNGIILSGGPCSVYEKDSPSIEKDIFNLNIPIFGICYGMQIISNLLGGKVISSSKKEFGKTAITILDNSSLFKNFDKNKENIVWMSHGDKIEKIPDNFEIIASSDNTPNCAIANYKKKIYAVQFHPEVVHTENGNKILENFIFNICKCEKDWKMNSFIDEQIKIIKDTVKDSNVILGLSGGVDSSVAAALISKAIGKQLKCIFVNNGLLRKNEAENIIDTFKSNFDIDLIYVDASKRFLEKLKNITDPEQKRKIIGKEFIEVFDLEAQKIKNVKFLAQGTLYPDVVESVSFKGGPSQVIKSHHNVGGLPEKMNLKLLEPFRELFKDEVRIIGQELGVSEEIIFRQPFPGPGLAIRILGDITEEKLNILRKADSILLEEIKKANLYKKVWQSFVVLLPIKSVGVQGDGRTYANTCVLRIVESNDGMTADWAKISFEVLEKISTKITNEVKEINRVVYDISSKPPSTIEWE